MGITKSSLVNLKFVTSGSDQQEFILHSEPVQLWSCFCTETPPPPLPHKCGIIVLDISFQAPLCFSRLVGSAHLYQDSDPTASQLTDDAENILASPQRVLDR